MEAAVHLSVLLAVVASLAGPPGVLPVDAGGIEYPSDKSVRQSGPDPDRVLLRFDVREDGSAVARVEYRFALETTNDTAAFTRFRGDVAANRTRYLDRFERRVTGTVRAAGNATGREMRVSDATVGAETRQLPQPYGVVVYSFTWHGFAEVTDGELRVGEALAGLYLDEETRLQITWPEGYAARVVQESADERRDRAAVWTGPTWFDREGPRVVLVREGFRLEPVPAALLASSALFALSGLAFWWRASRWTAAPAPTSHPAPDGSGATGPDGDRGATTDSPGETAGTTGETVDEALLSNEERVLRELKRRGGRAKQGELVSALGWSDAKVSRVVSGLRERGDVEAFRLGNRNVLSLPSERGGEDRRSEGRSGGDGDSDADGDGDRGERP